MLIGSRQIVAAFPPGPTRLPQDSPLQESEAEISLSVARKIVGRWVAGNAVEFRDGGRVVGTVRRDERELQLV